MKSINCSATLKRKFCTVQEAGVHSEDRQDPYRDHELVTENSSFQHGALDTVDALTVGVRPRIEVVDLREHFTVALHALLAAKQNSLKCVF